VLVVKEGKICILKDMQAKEIGKTTSYPAKVRFVGLHSGAGEVRVVLTC
jgi:hypothetical protein